MSKSFMGCIARVEIEELEVRRWEKRLYFGHPKVLTVTSLIKIARNNM